MEKLKILRTFYKTFEVWFASRCREDSEWPSLETKKISYTIMV
jgi:hypothetical protein